MKFSSELDLFQLLAQTAEDDKETLVLSIIQQAKDGEKSAIDLIAKTLIDQKFKPEERIKLEKKQLQDIVILAARRIEQARAAKAA